MNWIKQSLLDKLIKSLSPATNNDENVDKLYLQSEIGEIIE